MSEFFFVLKTVLFSVFLLMVLQMKVAGVTLEQRTEGWIYRSQIGLEMQTVAQGAVRAGHEGWHWLRQKSQDIGVTRERPRQSRSQNDDLD